MPGPVTVSQTYMRRVILERWDAEVKACELARKTQLMDPISGPSITPAQQAYLKRLIIERWDAEVKRCEEARKAHLLELLLAAHGISNLV
jgi:hypothetical protein